VDHQNKADVAASKAREWFDTGKVDAIMDVAVSAPALAVLEVAKQKQKVIIFNGPGTDRLTNDLCMPSTVHYVYDTYALANVTASAITQRGGKDWFFITADYAFGHSLQEQASAVVTAQGGKVLGAAKHPIGATDFASFLLNAQNSKAQVIGLANSGGDTVNTIKAAREFGLTQGKNKQTLAGLLMYINDIHAIGLRTAGGLMLTEAFYWDMNDATRAWSKRYFEKMKKMPNMSQAGAYSSTMHYLKAVQAAKTDDTATVMAQMKATPINDFFAKNGRIREDGRMVHDMYLFEVKPQAESKYPWDYYKLLATVPGDKAFLPLAQSKCPMVNKK
jgi:branched-chain amino acid transport system substrate-binding protein